MRQTCLAYLLGLDALVRVFAAYVIGGLMYGGLWLVIQLIVRLPFGESAAGDAFFWVALLGTPLIVRYGLLGSGLHSGPVFWTNRSSRETPESTSEESNRP